MTKDLVFWTVAICFGAWMTIHCPRAAIREYRNGVALGRYGEYRRYGPPLAFWTTIVATFLAGVFGLLIVAFGVGAIWTGAKTFG